MAYSFLRQPVATSRTAAMSGIKPMMRNTVETVKYVPMANSSQMSGDLKLGQSPRSLGYGISQYRYHWRPIWISGNSPAVITANTVIASAVRYTAVRHPERKRNRIAEISVPECAMPTQNTKQVM